ncbi:hypothetical protein [Marilutibacter chinensis]|uniref:Uncharacterized protein n=1 Tax=Marilutibacter chinensis TaxID=2912247 RepID=A0ABS9HQD3_9GAMM|nr:hypothetical protein [Lysobacter chinensis]MCF7221161.1 hypothetical protein [Lysobacter chinensis]MCF7223098.1 hypothetical protein [Lysobacter chinensis]
MNASLRALVLSLAAVGLAACASMPEKSAQAERAPTIMDADEAYVAYVERVARRRGIEVVWVNVPRAKVPTEDRDN